MSRLAAEQGAPAPSKIAVPGHRPIEWMAYALPLVLIAVLVLLYLISPRFYLKYVLEVFYRESQAVEVVTVCAAFVASILLLWSGWWLWRAGVDSMPKFGVDPRVLKGPALLRGRGGAVVIGAVGLAAFFFAGEEVNWGENFLYWGVPEHEKGLDRVTNVHNKKLPISVQGLGSVFLGAVIFGMPILWRMRRRWPQISDWAPAIAEGPVIFAMAIAILWSELKTVYVTLYPDVADIEAEKYHAVLAQINGEVPITVESPLLHYVGFFEQIREHKEMLVAVTLLLFGLYRLGKLKRLSARHDKPVV